MIKLLATAQCERRVLVAGRDPQVTREVVFACSDRRPLEELIPLFKKGRDTRASPKFWKPSKKQKMFQFSILFAKNTDRHHPIDIMPKAKKIRANALVSQQIRHEPLGQVIEGDEMRGKYAAPSRGRRKNKKSGKDVEEFLDEKSSKRILDMTRDQQNEFEMEERARKQKMIQYQHSGVVDSDEEYDEEEIIIEEEE